MTLLLIGMQCNYKQLFKLTNFNQQANEQQHSSDHSSQPPQQQPNSTHFNQPSNPLKTFAERLFSILNPGKAEKKAPQTYAYVGGHPIGIKIHTKGLIVIKTQKIETNTGAVNPAQGAGIIPGDIIIKINNQDIKDNAHFRKLIQATRGANVQLSLIRAGTQRQATLKPAFNKHTNKWTAGIQARDSYAGIGTMTYITQQGEFAALGHGISDKDTEILMPIKTGEIVAATIQKVNKPTSNKPGELVAKLERVHSLGRITRNTTTGIYGQLEQTAQKTQLMPLAAGKDITKGEAHIITTTDSQGQQKHSIKIDKIHHSQNSTTFDITITDRHLLDKTGGICQGMSGSPIIQRGKIVGALTHVFQSNSNRGKCVNCI